MSQAQEANKLIVVEKVKLLSPHKRSNAKCYQRSIRTLYHLLRYKSSLNMLKYTTRTKYRQEISALMIGGQYLQKMMDSRHGMSSTKVMVGR